MSTIDTTAWNAMEQALEALELCNGAETAEGVVVYTDKEITALREALAEQPAQRKPLTDEEIIDIRRKTTAKQHGEWVDTKAFARAIEARLKEKNSD